MKKKILYFSMHVHKPDVANSGIQKVVRFTAKSFLKNGYDLVPAKIVDNNIFYLNEQELINFSKDGGPSPEHWNVDYSKNIDLNDFEFGIIPELATDLDLQPTLIFCKNNKVDLYAIFFDAIPAVLTKLYDEEWQRFHKNYMKELSKIKGVMAISQDATDQFKKIIPEAKNVVNIPLPNKFIEGTSFEEKINNTKKINLLFVSTIEGRKNHSTLINAFEIANNKLSSLGYDLTLHFAGSTRILWKEYSDFVEDACLRLPIIWHKSPSDKEVLDLYKMADFTVYPSTMEGFGLPIIESLFHNTPVLVANNSSLKEIASLGGCLTFDTLDTNNLANLIIKMSVNSKLRSALVEEIKNIPNYTWDDYIENIVKFAGEKK
jgi:glycosyltransferase involved in cell wall biosynthesis